jgi:DNA-binding XRE family transcriptional regulator
VCCGACCRVATVGLVRPADLAVIARTRASLADGSARLAREAAGVSAPEVAAAAGVARQSVSAWESGRAVPSARHALAYARLLAAVAVQAA